MRSAGATGSPSAAMAARIVARSASVRARAGAPGGGASPAQPSTPDRNGTSAAGGISPAAEPWQLAQRSSS